MSDPKSPVVGLREKAQKFEEALGEDCQHSSEYGRCQECSIELFVEAMLAAFKEGEKAVCMRCARGDQQINRDDTVGHFVHEVFDGYTTSFVWCTAAAIAQLRTSLWADHEAKTV